MVESKQFMDIDEKLVLNGKLYLKDNLPSQISNALYNFGSMNVFEILAFIDSSEELDGSKGMIITPDEIYFKFGQAGNFKYQEITGLSLQKHHHDQLVKIIIRTVKGSYAFSNKTIDPEILVNFLAKITDLKIEMIMTNHEKVAYYVPIVLADLSNDEYEDIELTNEQIALINELNQDLKVIDGLDEENYCYELENLCNRALDFFDELGLDSEEIDELEKVQEQFNQTDLAEDQKIDDAKRFYDDMMDKYSQGDTEMYDRVKSMMAQMGIDENELAGKSTEEIEDLLCEKFGISKSMMEKLVKKFGNR
ncbi:hypothetical protein [Thomasclavelia sp.]|uniref:hypothetical protein n=1 Tax=Thomasclavelia sp. TaxID=3025757 RepID=UPI0025EB243D|nr:hypothetical protein [Thomasclavelia sp.]